MVCPDFDGSGTDQNAYFDNLALLLFLKKIFLSPKYKILVYMKKSQIFFFENIFSNDVLIVHSVWKSYKMSHFTQIKNATNKLKT